MDMSCKRLVLTLLLAHILIIPISSVIAAPVDVEHSASGGTRTMAMPLISSMETIVYESPDPQNVFAYGPSILRLPSGRLIVSMDVGGPDAVLYGPQPRTGSSFGKVFTSDDGGATWIPRAEYPFIQARLFLAGDSVYLLGQAGDLMIMRSDDGGETWSYPSRLTSGKKWHSAPGNVHYRDGRLYLIMERNTDPSYGGWPVSRLAPVLISAPVDANLMDPSVWVYSNELVAHEVMNAWNVGIPFFPRGTLGPGRTMYEIGWLEGHVTQIYDPQHVWYDSSGRTFHILLRAHTGQTNWAAILKAVESEDRQSINVSLVEAPSGQPMVLMPFPGGHLKFHILFDEESGLYWLLGSQSTDSMTRPELLPGDRIGLPQNERHRLALYYSRNLVDWIYVGLVADSGSPKEARHYASMVVDGDDLVIASRSGDHRAKTAHDGNLITFHRVPNFRSLADPYVRIPVPPTVGDACRCQDLM